MYGVCLWVQGLINLYLYHCGKLNFWNNRPKTDVLYTIPFAQANFLLPQLKMHLHWVAGERYLPSVPYVSSCHIREFYDVTTIYNCVIGGKNWVECGCWHFWIWALYHNPNCITAHFRWYIVTSLYKTFRKWQHPKPANLECAKIGWAWPSYVTICFM